MLKQGHYNNVKLKTILKTKKIIFPVVIKPANEGSSIGVKICKNISELKNATNTLFKNI